MTDAGPPGWDRMARDQPAATRTRSAAIARDRHGCDGDCHNCHQRCRNHDPTASDASPPGDAASLTAALELRNAHEYEGTEAR